MEKNKCKFALNKFMWKLWKCIENTTPVFLVQVICLRLNGRKYFPYSIYKICRCSNDSRDYSFATLENINVPYILKSVCYCINWGYLKYGNNSGNLSNNICWHQLPSTNNILQRIKEYYGVSIGLFPINLISVSVSLAGSFSVSVLAVVVFFLSTTRCLNRGYTFFKT